MLTYSSSSFIGCPRTQLPVRELIQTCLRKVARVQSSDHVMTRTHMPACLLPQRSYVLAVCQILAHRPFWCSSYLRVAPTSHIWNHKSARAARVSGISLRVGLQEPGIRQRGRALGCRPAWPMQLVRCSGRVWISVGVAPATRRCCCHPRSRPSFRSKGLLSAARCLVQVSIPEHHVTKTPVSKLIIDRLSHQLAFGCLLP